MSALELNQIVLFRIKTFMLNGMPRKYRNINMNTLGKKSSGIFPLYGLRELHKSLNSYN